MSCLILVYIVCREVARCTSGGKGLRIVEGGSHASFFSVVEEAVISYPRLRFLLEQISHERYSNAYLKWPLSKKVRTHTKDR